MSAFLLQSRRKTSRQRFADQFIDDRLAAEGGLALGRMGFLLAVGIVQLTIVGRQNIAVMLTRAFHSQMKLTMRSRIAVLLFSSLLFAGCNDHDSEIEKLRAENAALRQQIQTFTLSSTVLLESVKSAVAQGDLAAASQAIGKLETRYPSSSEMLEARRLISDFQTRVSADAEAKKLASEEEETARKKRLEEAAKSLVKSRDEIKRITWYKDKITTGLIISDQFDLYIGREDAGKIWLRLKLQYSADDWLFVQRFVIAADDARFDSGPIEFERDNSSGHIWEWVDLMVTERELRWVRAVIAAKSTTVRFQGRQYYQDVKITPAQVTALRNVMDAFSAMGGSLPQ